MIKVAAPAMLCRVHRLGDPGARRRRRHRGLRPRRGLCARARHAHLRRARRGAPQPDRPHGAEEASLNWRDAGKASETTRQSQANMPIRAPWLARLRSSVKSASAWFQRSRGRWSWKSLSPRAVFDATKKFPGVDRGTLGDVAAVSSCTSRLASGWAAATARLHHQDDGTRARREVDREGDESCVESTYPWVPRTSLLSRAPVRCYAYGARHRPQLPTEGLIQAEAKAASAGMSLTLARDQVGKISQVLAAARAREHADVEREARRAAHGEIVGGIADHGDLARLEKPRALQNASAMPGSGLVPWPELKPATNSNRSRTPCAAGTLRARRSSRRWRRRCGSRAA